MCRLAAGRGTGVQYPATRRRGQQRSRPLCAGVLYRYRPRGEAGQALDRYRVGQPDAIGQIIGQIIRRRPHHTRRSQIGKGSRHRCLPTIHPQRHRGRLIARRENGLPLFGIRRLQLFHPPGRMLRAGLDIPLNVRQQFLLAAQILAQDRIDQAFATPVQILSRRDHGLIDHRKLGLRPSFQPVKRQQQQGPDFRRTDRAIQQACQQGIPPPKLAQAAIDHVLHSRTHFCHHPANQAIGQTLTVENRHHHPPGFEKSKGQ